MSAAANQIDRLQQLGGSLFLDGDSIRYRIPADNPEAQQLLAEIGKDREAAIALLRDRECARNDGQLDSETDYSSAENSTVENPDLPSLPDKPVEKPHEPSVENSSQESTPIPDLRSKPCWRCHSQRFWLSVHGAVVCATCHPPASQQLVRQWIDISTPETPNQPESRGEKLDGCPFSLPKGVSVVRYEEKAAPVAITVCSVVNDLPKFIRHALDELGARLHSPIQIKAGDSVFLLLSKLADCGLELRLEWAPEGQIIHDSLESEPTKPSEPTELNAHGVDITDEDLPF